MFQPFSRWFRLIFDRANPIAVRELRRLKRPLLLGSVLIPCLLITYLATFSFVSDPHSLVGGIPATISMLCLIGGIYGIILASFHPPLSLLNSRLNGEMLELVPLPASVQVHGYLIPGFLMALFSCTLFLPFIVDPPTVSQYSSFYGFVQSPLWTVGILLLASQALSSYFLAFVSCVTTKGEALMAWLFSLLGFCLIFLPLLPIFADRLMVTDLTDLTYRGGPLGRFLSWYGISIICLLIGLTGYLLARYHFSRKRKSFRRSMIVNIVVFVLWCPISVFTIFILHFLRVASPFIYFYCMDFSQIY